MHDVAIVIEAGASDESLADAIQMLATLEIQAAAGDAERRFSMVAYSGGKLPVTGFPVPVVVDLAGLEATGDIPILIDHLKSVDATLGISKEIVNDGKSILISGVITGQGDRTKAVLAAAAAGHKWQASIGAQVLQAQEIPAGQTVKVNGQTFSGPLIVARRAVLRETSVLPMGADSSTSVNLAASAAKLSKEAEATMNRFQKWLNEMGIVEASLSDDRRASLQLAFEAETGETVDGKPVKQPVVVEAGAVATVPAIDVQGSLADLNRQVATQLRKHSEIQAKSRRTIYDPFMKLQTLAGINLHCEESHEHTAACHVYGFHDFRRGFATNNASTLSPAQLQRLMKHSDFSTTQRYINYAKVMTERPNVFVPEVLNQNSGNHDSGNRAGSR